MLTIDGENSQISGADYEMLLQDVEAARRFPKLCRYWFGPLRPSVQLQHPQSIKCMAQSAEPKPLSGKGGYTMLKPWLGEPCFEVVMRGGGCNRGGGGWVGDT